MRLNKKTFRIDNIGITFSVRQTFCIANAYSMI